MYSTAAYNLLSLHIVCGSLCRSVALQLRVGPAAASPLTEFWGVRDRDDLPRESATIADAAPPGHLQLPIRLGSRCTVSRFRTQPVVKPDLQLTRRQAGLSIELRLDAFMVGLDLFVVLAA